jgi:inorganic phosphate transporter, PiT family
MNFINILENMDTFTIIILSITIITGFYMAWNVGANDVANAMGTVVGSGSITIKQAIIVAAIFELAGAFLVGGSVTDTISKKIISPEVITNTTVFIIGMLAALIASSMWLNLATYFGWPVSTTHSIVGGVVGFGLIQGGIRAIYWEKIGEIAISWVISPLMGGILAFIVFKVIEKSILEKKNPVMSAKKAIPIIVAISTFLLVLSLLFKGLKNLHLDINFIEASLIGIAVSIVLGLFTYFILSKLNHDGGDETEKYEIVEGIFMKLQIATACYISFAHGANDVANTVGPIAGIYNAIISGNIADKTPVPSWILVMGAIGIVVGLATYGYKVIGTIGEKITEITPTRGFAAEMGTATTVLLASRLGLPISTTHTLIGAVVGVALGRGVAVLNVNIIKNIVASWVITIPFTAVLTIIILKFLMLFV